MKINIPTFETSRLILKPVELQYADDWQKHFAHYSIIQHLSFRVPWPYPENGAYEFIKNILLPEQGINRWAWGIFEKINPNELIGAIELFREGIPENRGFWLAENHWNKGYMSEAVKPVTNYAFSHLGFNKLIFSNAKGNIASKKVKEKSGARFIGTKASKLVNPIYTESELWEFTIDDWYKSFIGHYHDFQEADNSHYQGSDELLGIGSPIGRKLGLEKIGIHIELLKPGRRLSWPHAESLEEEFVFVIQGYPTAWLNGSKFPLKPGNMVAFPSGTGIAHTFINETQEDCLFLVGGETTKADNKIFYPLHPERNQFCQQKGTFWENHPQFEIKS